MGNRTHRTDCCQVSGKTMCLSSPVQDPQNTEMRIYRVFESIQDSSGTTVETGNALRGSALVSKNKAVRASLGSVIMNKAAVGSRDPMSMQFAIEDGNVEAEGQGGKASKRRRTATPRQPTEKDKQQKEFDTGMKKMLI